MSERASTQEQSIYLRHLLDEVRKNSHPVFLEGAYQVQTSSGQPLTIEVITQKGVIENNDDFYFFAFDEDGKLVGHRYTHLVLYEGAYEVGGMIVTRIRHRGYASAIEQAYFARLQEIANELNAQITDYLVDTNSNSSPDRASWENLYKVGGKLGYQDTDSGVAKVIQPGNVPAVARGASRFSQTEELFTALEKYAR